MNLSYVFILLPFIIFFVQADEYVEYEEPSSPTVNSNKTPSAFVFADILVYDSKSDCTTGESNIGGCINLEETNEQYLCDFATNDVYIALCKNKDCTNCEDPMPDYYGYINGQCQSNGFLKAKCTDTPWENKNRKEDL